MNKWTKIGLTVGVGAAGVTAAHIINQMIFNSATAGRVTDIDERHIYNWKFGNISYTVKGTGTPLLLIHDLQSTSSTYEWNLVVDGFSKNHTVYCIDLLGCGYSDKPNITYTTYMYTQLISDFVRHIIGKKTDVIATGDSAPIAIMSAYNNDEIFNRILLVNPQSIERAMAIPDKRSNIRRILLNSPIIGTMIYNICMSRKNTEKNFTNKLIYNKNHIKPSLIDAYYENSHLSGSCAKYLYTSCVCHYTTASVARAVKELNNCIYIISGAEVYESSRTANDYITLNPAIEVASIKACRHLPQIEQPKKFINTVNIFL